MQYTDRIKDEILQDMLGSSRDDVDKRQGSIVYDVQAPQAEEIEVLSYKLESQFENGFMGTAQDEYVELRGAEQNILRKQARFAKGQLNIVGRSGTDLPAGTIIKNEQGSPIIRTNEYTVIQNGTAAVKAEAIEAGIDNNFNAGLALNCDIDGIESVSNDVFDGGIDEESDQSMKDRYFFKVQKPITSGNIYHYEMLAREIPGVGQARVVPIWAGNGTVKIILIGDNGRAPSQLTVAEVLAHIQKEQIIGADQTVVAVTEVPLNIAVNLTLEGDLLQIDVQAAVEQNISNYLSESGTIVRYAQIHNAIIDTDGVIDLNSLTVNLGALNIDIDDQSVAIVGSVIIT